MKKLLVLALPVLLLTACNGGGSSAPTGKEISKEEAKVIATKIAEKGVDAKGIEITVASEQGTYDEEKQKNVKTVSNSTLKYNSDGTFDLVSETTVDGVKATYHYIYVLDETYEAVLYTSDGTEEVAYAKSLDDSFDLTLSFYMLAAQAINLTVTMFANPVSFFSEQIPETVSIKYYSSGENNLAIQIANTSSGEGQQGEYAASSEYIVKYDDLTLKSVESKATSNLGNESKSLSTVKFSSDSLKITLPEGWEDHIVEPEPQDI